ncbi:hypothetical protein IW261DRAFT_1466121 [Armillaria novae-zelandiae]|uniref:Secreted protein n=1 Tax=Armillaria novae-zelandiae TaxID=153914 RepID=A0AA39UCA0_9AGAR|nr:hypothetical protein IW261DRAFT_1466121 [Armillaria novae-zelandiae]
MKIFYRAFLLCHARFQLATTIAWPSDTFFARETTELDFEWAMEDSGLSGVDNWRNKSSRCIAGWYSSLKAGESCRMEGGKILQRRFQLIPV